MASGGNLWFLLQTYERLTVFQLDKRLYQLICHGKEVLDTSKLLALEMDGLIPRIPALAELPHQAVLPLAKLVADGEATAWTLHLALDIQEADIAEHLDALYEAKFVDYETDPVTAENVFVATKSGADAFLEISKRVVTHERLVLQARLDQLNRLHEHFNASDANPL